MCFPVSASVGEGETHNRGLIQRIAARCGLWLVVCGLTPVAWLFNLLRVPICTRKQADQLLSNHDEWLSIQAQEKREGLTDAVRLRSLAHHNRMRSWFAGFGVPLE